MPLPPLSIRVLDSPECVIVRVMNDTRFHQATYPSEEDGLPLIRSWSAWRADLSAGVSSALVAVPVAIGAGLVAFAPLGPEYASVAVQAGLVTAVMGAILSALFASSRYTVGGPSAAVSLLLASGLAQFITAKDAPFTGQVLAVTGVLTLISGLLILAMGALKLGRVVKFVPRPVVAGFANGLALVVIYSQISPALGMEEGWSLSREAFESVKWGAAFTTGATLAGCWAATRVSATFPPVLLGLICGSAVHFGLLYLAGESVVGALIGSIPKSLAASVYLPEMKEMLESLKDFESLIKLFMAALLIAVINAIQILMTATTVDAAANARHDANRELMGFGLGSVFVSMMGGVPNTSAHGRAMAQLQGGGRTRWAAIFSGVSVLLIVLLALPVLGHIPVAVLAGVLIFSALKTFDPWAKDQMRRLLDKGERGEVLENVVVLQTMTGGMTTLGLNPGIVVVMGFVVTMLTFVKRISGSVIRASYTCENRRSRKVRLGGQADRLQTLGARIRVFELEGALFFGTADRLREEVESVSRETDFVILDCRRVRDWDSTGAQIIGQAARYLEKRGTHFLLTYVKGRHDIETQVRAYGLFKDIPETSCFADDDTALEFAEDHLLGEDLTDGHLEQAIASSVLFVGLDGLARERMLSYFTLQSIAADSMVFRAGDAGDSLYVLRSGEVTLGIEIAGRNEWRRLATLTAGQVFGEMALIDRRARSANARANGTVELWVLDRVATERMQLEDPTLYIALLTNLARELSGRLRSTTDQLRALEAE